MSSLIGGPVGLTTPGVPPLTGRWSVAYRPHPRDLLHVTGLHLEPLGKGLDLSGAEDVVGGGEPHVDDLKPLIALVGVDHLVDGRVPVKR